MRDLTIAHIQWTVQDNETRHACDKFFNDVFAAQTGMELLLSPDLINSGQDREESLMVIADTMLIPIAPAGRGHEADSVLGKMCREFAKPSRWMGIALHTADIDAAAAWFEERNLKRVYRPFDTHFFLSDADQTLGIRFEFMDFRLTNDPRLRPDYSSAWWRDVHPLGIERLQSIGTTVKDLGEARRFYTETFPWEEISSRRLAGESADAATFLIGDTVIEAMSPRDMDTPLARHAHEYGGVYCLNFKVKDAAAAARYLRDLDLTLEGDTDHRFWIDPAQAYGRRLVFTSEALAGDPRH